MLEVPLLLIAGCKVIVEDTQLFGTEAGIPW